MVNSQHRVVQIYFYRNPSPPPHPAKQGWGASFYIRQASGEWSATERPLHISILELKGAFM